MMRDIMAEGEQLAEFRSPSRWFASSVRRSAYPGRGRGRLDHRGRCRQFPCAPRLIAAVGVPQDDLRQLLADDGRYIELGRAGCDLRAITISGLGT